MIKKARQKTALRVRSHLKAGLNLCKLCHLNCFYLDGKKREICDDICDTIDYCKTA